MLNQVIKLREQSLTLDGEKEEQSCPNDKINELCEHFNGHKNERR